MNKIESFRKRIYEHLRDYPQMFDASGVPIPVTVYFFSKANEGTITGKELEIEYRLSSLMQCLKECIDMDMSKKHASKYIRKSYRYKNRDMSIEIRKSEDDITLDIEYGKYHLRTNAFIFDKKQDYYFDSYWIIETVSESEKHLLGKEISLNLNLRKE